MCYTRATLDYILSLIPYFYMLAFLSYNMRDSWITEVGETGLVRLTERDGSWFVTNPLTEQETKCILQGEFSISEDDQSAEIKIR